MNYIHVIHNRCKLFCHHYSKEIPNSNLYIQFIKFSLNKHPVKQTTILYELLSPTFLFCLQQSLYLQKEE